MTVPCVAFAEHLSCEQIGAFISAAIRQYRLDNKGVFHFSTSEEDTQENWYANQHSQMAKLSKALQLAGFAFLGGFDNYFNNGGDLLGFCAVYLGIKQAIKCLEANFTKKYFKAV